MLIIMMMMLLLLLVLLLSLTNCMNYFQRRNSGGGNSFFSLMPDGSFFPVLQVFTVVVSVLAPASFSFDFVSKWGIFFFTDGVRNCVSLAPIVSVVVANIVMGQFFFLLGHG